MITQQEKHLNQEMESYAITISINPVQRLQTLTEQELTKLQLSKRKMESVHSNLDLLLKRYNLEKSYFGQMAGWYGKRAWWIKLILFVLVAGIGAAIGMLINMPITIVLVSSALYIFFAFFFINHYEVTEQQTKRLCEDIIELEKSLTETINHFNAISNKLKDITKNMHELNSQFLTDMQNMQTNITELTQQLAKYKNIISELQTTKDELTSSTKQTYANLESGRLQFNKSRTIITEQAEEITEISHSLNTSQQSLSISSEQLAKLTNTYQVTSEHIEIAATYATALIDSLKTLQTRDTHTRSPSINSNSDNDSTFTDEEVSTTTNKSSAILGEARQARESSSKALARLNDLTQAQKNTTKTTEPRQ